VGSRPASLLKCNISFNSMFFENAKLKNFEVTLKVII
jgi:hypothetical protein